MKPLFTALALSFLLSSCSMSNYYVRRAGAQEDKGNLREAKKFFLKALSKKPDHYEANLGLGIMYTEWMDNYADATPLLEKAYSKSKRDTSYDLLFALAKCYHHEGEYDKALSFYARLGKVRDLEGEFDFQKEVNKRMADCHYAKSKKYDPPSADIYLVNAGRQVNTDMPEYVPVIVGNELIFTSKRKDDKRESLNADDGKYYESMYISTFNGTSFKPVRRYTLPDEGGSSSFSRSHESIVSVSADGTKLFSFKKGKIYEINVADLKSAQPKRSMSLTRRAYQNHAFLAPDGKTLYFTANMADGLGGNDIYKCVKGSDGEWGLAENLGNIINTSFDEEAPFIGADGTLYFSSKGHEGYGNFDIYKSIYTNGQWSAPLNLGVPFNSPGHDIFLTYDAAGAAGFLSSGRNGGFGDMDIYRFVHLDKFKGDCTPLAADFAPLTVTPENSAFRISIVLPPHLTPLKYEWSVDGSPVNQNTTSLVQMLDAVAAHTITARFTAKCDTCLSPLVICSSTVTAEEKKPIVALPLPDNTVTAVPSQTASKTGILTGTDLTAIGFNTASVLFDFNKSDLRDDAAAILTTNADVLKKNGNLVIEITGHSDVRGSERANRNKSEKRAEAVRRFLLKQGVKRSQIISVKGAGTSQLANNCTEPAACGEDGHAANRRVTLKVSRK
jgi:outer membrane protein OmpA-like peptidoglycan-associated protein/tetratricopeptide (TPR) repeat protein